MDESALALLQDSSDQSQSSFRVNERKDRDLPTLLWNN